MSYETFVRLITKSYGIPLVTLKCQIREKIKTISFASHAAKLNLSSTLTLTPSNKLVIMEKVLLKEPCS